MKKTAIKSLLLAMLLCAPWLAHAQNYGDHIVGSGDATNAYVPVYGYYADAYLRCQTLYPADSLTSLQGGTITNLRYYISTTASSVWSSTFVVKMGVVTATTLTSHFDTTTLTTVYTGGLNGTSSIMDIELDTPFTYNGGNLLVEVYSTNTGNYSSCSFFGAAVNGASVQAYSSSFPVTGGGAKNFMPKTNFFCANLSCMKPGRPYIESLTATAATINWAPSTTADAYYITLGDEEYTCYDTTYTFTTLTANTEYTFTVRSSCGGDSSDARTLVFRTPCVLLTSADLPYNEDFDASATISPCWYTYFTEASSYSNYPTISSMIDGLNGNCLFFYSSTGVISYAALTPVDTEDIPISSLTMTFKAKKYDYEYEEYKSRLIVGVMSDATDITTFDTVATIDMQNLAAGTVVEQEVNFAGYQGDGNRIAILAPDTPVPSGAWYVYNYFYIDDISLSRTSTCATPVQVEAGHITHNSAQITWNDTSDSYASAMVYWNTENDLATADSAEVVGDNNYTLTDLMGSTTYYVWVKGVCSDEGSRAVRISFTTNPSCAQVENLIVNGVDFYAFGLTWTAPSMGEDATAYIVSYKADTADVWFTDTVTTNSYYFANLTQGTTYNYRVSSLCDTAASSATMDSVTTLRCGVIGTPDNSSTYIPLNCFYNYSYSQQIYLASEMAGLGDTIHSIAFYNTSSSADPRTVKLYLANTDKVSFSSYTDYIPLSDLQLVYSGVFNPLGGQWDSIIFDNAFVRDGRNLAVVVCDSTGDYDGNTYFSTYNTTQYRSIYFYQDGSYIDPANPSAGSCGNHAQVCQIVIGASCEVPDCPMPMLSVVATADDEITLAWDPEQSAATYTLFYRKANDTVWNSITDITANTFTVTGLESGCDYNFRLTMPCGSTTLSATIDASTQCGNVQVPYTENFETAPFGYFARTCWTVGTTAPSMSQETYPSVVSLTGSDNRLLLLYRGGYVILPAFAEDLSSLQISFTLTQTDNVPLLIGLMSDPADNISQMHILDTLYRSRIDAASTSTNVTYRFDNIGDDTARYIAIWSRDGVDYSFIDDIVVGPIPACSQVADLTVSNITESSADVSWSSTSDLASSFVVEYGPRGFEVGTGSVLTTTSNSIALSNLNHGVDYTVYVTSICASSGDTSAAVALNFTVACAAYTDAELPYVQDFEGILEPGVSQGRLPNCWSFELLTDPAGYYHSSYYYPSTYYDQYGSFSPVPGNYNLMLTGLSVVALPEMDVPIDSLMISFSDYNSATSDYGLIIGTVDSITPGFAQSFVALDTLNYLPASSNYTYNFTKYFTNYTGHARYLAFKNYYANTSYTSEYSGHYIDNIVISHAPSCVAPMDFATVSATTTSVNLTWDVSQAADYIYEYGPAGFVRGTGTTGSCTGRALTLSNLTRGTSYDIYVQGICSATDSSLWSEVYTFHTANADPVTTFPYYCDFTDSTLTNAGFELVNGSEANAWFVGNAVSNLTPRSLYISNDNGTSHSYNNSSSSTVYAYRDFVVANNAPFFFSFDWIANGESSYDYIRAFVVPASQSFVPGARPDNASSYDFTTSVPQGWIALDDANRLNGSSSWATKEASLNLAAGAYRLLFIWTNDGSSGNNPPAAIDNIIISPITCPRPYDFTYTATASSVNLTWNDSVQGTGYEVEYGAGNFSHGDGILLSTTTPSITLTSLDALTNYTVYVRHICSATDTGMWAKTVVQTAMCDGVQIAQNFDTATSVLSTSSYMPAYSFYNHSFSQSIIPASDLAGLSNITAFAFLPASTTAGTYYTNCEIYLSHTTLTEFNSEDDVVDMVDTNSTLVYSGDLNFNSTDWRMTGFDTPFEYDGTSNVIITIVRNHGDYLSGCEFNTVETSGQTTIYGYDDNVSLDASSLSSWTGYAMYVADEQPLYRFYSCGATCAQPVVTSATQTYEDITLNWSAANDTCEVAIAQGLWVEPTATTQVIGSTYTFAGLNPATTYSVGVRQHCAEGAVSDWTVVELTTDSLPCFAPEALSQTASTYRSVTLSWTAGGEESHWQVRVYNTTFDSIYDATTTTATVSGLQPGITYSAAVRALCGSSLIAGDWSDAITVTTADCQPVTNVHVTNVTAQAATIAWTAGGSENAWVIEYSDMPDFAAGTGTIVNAATNPFDLPLAGFEPETEYYFYVYAQCDASLRSVASNRGSFTTQNVGIDDVDATRSVSIYPNPATHAATLTLSGVDGQLHIDIVDMNGRKVQSLAAVADGGLTTTLDLSTLAQGAYFVRIYGDDFSSVKKLVVR